MIRGARELDARARSSRRLGFLGGSFDPPHLGHLHLARVARWARGLDHVVFVPAGRPPHKAGRELAAVEKRIRALEVLLEHEPDVSIWTVEAERPGQSYTIDTLRTLGTLLAQKTRIYLLLGEDNLPGLPAWREVEAILALAEPVVVPRCPTACGSEREDAARGLSELARERLAQGRVGVEALDASSTEIRSRLERGEDPGGSLPRSLRDYLIAERLYSAR